MNAALLLALLAAAPGFCARRKAGPLSPIAPLPLPAAATAVGLAPRAVDQTAMLRQIQRAVRAGEAGKLPPEARLHRFLFAPGFSWDAIPNYFEPNIKRLRDLGLDAELVPTDPLGTNKENGKLIAAAVKRDPRPVVLIGHSKGGVDAIVGLQQDKKAREQVTKLVAIQSPYAGTAVADWFEARPLLAATSLAYLRMLNPFNFLKVSPFFRHQTIRELTRRARGYWANRPPFSEGGPEVFTVASRVTADTAIRLALWISAGTAKQVSGLDNDGIVAPEEAQIPGARAANLEHVGHIDTVSDAGSWKYKRLGVRGHDGSYAADLTEAVVRWLFTAR